ncbi:hypothetical protein NC652_034426 [Populus alba x Populus x berolinensis]|nr:hypothetical protein NC652_034426 [Populus alba x Populus x berolinensis]
MVKLARESRMYRPRLARNRGEYMNAGLCVFAAIVLVGGFVAQLSKEPNSGLVLLLITLLLIMGVNLHNLVAHLVGIDYRFPLMGFDTQLALVEFAVPVVQASGALLSFLANVVKVFKKQQIDGLRLEKLRGGAHERLTQEREGHSALILEEERRRKTIAVETRAAPLPATTPYKDVLFGQP